MFGNHKFTLGMLVLLGLLLAEAVLAEPRTALVIGNAAYADSLLANLVNDARDIAKALQSMGFTVTLREDLQKRAMEEGISEFSRHLQQEGGVGLFFYSGHGAQLNGRNYLIPVGATVRSEADVVYEAVDAGRLLDHMEEAGNRLNIIILDACRDNPFGRRFQSTRGGGLTRGLAQMDAPAGSIIAYSTAPGRVAEDGSGRNSPYTSALLAVMNTSGLGIEQVFKQVRNRVIQATGNKQVPWESTSLRGDFYFVAAQATTLPVEPPPEQTHEPAPVAQQVQNSQISSSNDFSARELTKVTYVDGKEYVLRQFMFYSDPYFDTTGTAPYIDQDTGLLVRTGKQIWRIVKPVDIKSIEMTRKSGKDAFQTNIVLKSGAKVKGETPQDIEETWLPGKLGVSGKVKTIGSQEQYLWVNFNEISKINSEDGSDFRVKIEKTNGQSATLKSVSFQPNVTPETNSPIPFSGFWNRKNWYGSDKIPVTVNGIDIPDFDLTKVETLTFRDAGKIEIVVINGDKGVMSFRKSDEYGGEENVTHIYGELDTGEILFDEIYSQEHPKVRLIHFIKGQ